MLFRSRGTSCILLAVYFMYLNFQLRTHKHLYVGTPQHILDEEAAPGPLANWFDSSSDSSSSDSDSDDSSGSGAVAKLQNFVRRRGKRAGSNESASTVNPETANDESLFQTPEPHPGTPYIPGSSPTEGDNSPPSDRQSSFGAKLTKLDRKERKRQKKAKKKEKKERKRADKKAHEIGRAHV